MNWPGRVVLLIVIIISLSLFLRKFLAALRIILAAKPDADFHLAPVGPLVATCDHFAWRCRFI